MYFSYKKGVGRQHTTFISCQHIACSNDFFFPWRVDHAREENVLTEQIWFLPIISYKEVVTHFLRLLCLVGIWFALWCKSIFFDLFWNVKLFNAAKLRVLGCLISPKCLPNLNNYEWFSFCSWKWRFPVMFCHAGLSSLAFLAGC